MDKKNEEIAFEVELLFRKTNTNTGAVELVSKMYVLLRDSYETAKKDSQKILYDKYEHEAVFSNDKGHIINQEPIEVVSITKSGNLGANWMIKAALGDFGYQVGVVEHLTPEDLPAHKTEKINEKTAFNLELLYRWTNTETGSEELVSRIFVILRESFEHAKRDSVVLLHSDNSMFRNEEGVIINQSPVKVVSVKPVGRLGAAWIIKSALANFGFEAGVVRHQTPNDFPEN